jgi:hypothetical protein
MDQWFRIPLTADEIASNVLMKIEIEFSRRWIASNRNGIALLITQRPNEPADPNNTALFVTPLAVPLCADFIRRYRGTPCSEPPPSEAEWVAGDDKFMSSVRLASKAHGL